MRKYLLDTSVVAGYLLARTKAIQLVRPLLAQEEVATSMLVYGEVAEYVKKFASFNAYKASLEALLEQIYPYPLTYAILERYADIRRTLRPLHQDIGDIDTLIAATAIEHNLTIVTIDHDFQQAVILCDATRLGFSTTMRPPSVLSHNRKVYHSITPS